MLALTDERTPFADPLRPGDWIEIRRACCGPAAGGAPALWIEAEVVAAETSGFATRRLLVRLASGRLLRVPMFVPWRRMGRPRRLPFAGRLVSGP